MDNQVSQVRQAGLVSLDYRDLKDRVDRQAPRVLPDNKAPEEKPDRRDPLDQLDQTVS